MNRSRSRESSFARLLSRREMLGYTGTAVAVAIFGCGRERSGRRDSIGGPNLQSTAAAATTPACVVRPEQTEGPYFIDAKLNRSDIRSEPADRSVKPGVPLRLAFHLSRIDGAACSPLGDAIVDVWHCDALGAYSDVRDTNVGFDARGKKFLRGYQVTNANGIAEFLTIYPGWYAGRAVHIHFKIRGDSPSRRSFEFTSQLYFDEAVTDQVYKQSPYNSRGTRTTTNDKDSIFRRGGKQLMPALTKDAQGYLARFDIGLKLA
jgi:protocatechuate 3,4-dioxygenase beta subunit